MFYKCIGLQMSNVGGVRCLLSFFVHKNCGDVKEFEKQCSFLRENYKWIWWTNFTNPDTKLLKCPDLCNSITLDWWNNLSSFEIIRMVIWKFFLQVGAYRQTARMGQIKLNWIVQCSHFRISKERNKPKIHPKENVNIAGF